MSVQVRYTYQDLLTAPQDRNRYEIFDGDLIMTPAPGRAHQFAVGNLYLILSNFCVPRGFGKVVLAPFDVFFDEETVVEPDLFFVASDRLHIIDDRKVNGAPDLIVEVLSPSTEARDRGFKFKRYAQEGVREYWLVDPTNKTIEVYQLADGGFVLAGKYERGQEARSPILEGLSFKVDNVWA
jgi:Uma2 family endonuclease